MPEYTLPRTGQRPLAFTGELLAEADNNDRSRDATRWHEVAVYRTAEGGRYVLAITLRTRHDGEHDHYHVTHATDPATIEAALRDYDPCPDGIGYPPGPSYAERQARVEKDLRRRYDALIVRVFAALGPEFAEALR